MTMFPLNFESLNLTNMPTTASSLFSAYASLNAFIMLVRSMLDQLIPHELRYYIFSFFRRLFTFPSSDLTLIVDESCGMEHNTIYEAAEVYLRTKISPTNDRLRVRKAPRQKNITVTIEKGEEIKDSFEGININWRCVCSGGEDERNRHAQQKRQFELTVKKKHRVKVIESYLPYVLERAEAIKNENKVVKLYSQMAEYDPYDSDGGSSDWNSINLEHPANFATLAMDPEVKRTIIEDLDRFLRRREFYKKVGKAWKRGYLLYGPPGTGKSSLIAAMANYLKFDIYDVELTSILDNSELRRILLSTTNRSILVIEDIDCSVEMQNRDCQEDDHQPSNTKITLSGLLNFIDGLWSSCGDERIIVFTTNHKHKIDPALLRPGRMDVHIHMSYCTPSGFRILASNYLGIQESNPHRLCGEIEELIESTKVTPAEIAEEFMRSEDADVALEGLVELLKKKKEESNKIVNERTDKSKIQKTDQDEEKGELIIFPMYPFDFKDMPTSASSLFSAYASLAAFIMLVRSMVDQLIPHELRSYIYSFIHQFFYTPRCLDMTVIIDEKCGYIYNEVYEAAEVYLQTKISDSNERLRVTKTPGQKSLNVVVDKDQEIIDFYDGIKLSWRFVCAEDKDSGSRDDEKRRFELIFHKKHRTKVIDSYLSHVLARANAIREEEKVLKLDSQRSGSVDLEHPSTFDTLAMDPELKKTIIEDLDRFVRRKEFYRKVGKAWKRGYLLYGPPGTGKSSLIAAMANYLKFDVYDLELTSVYDNSELRRILLSTSNRSILVIEDIDCSVDIQNRESEEDNNEQSNTRVTLSGLLNFIDGLWSSCGDERIIVFTTNNKDKLDPALLRPGRMDVHIHMSYCTPRGFRVLASNYLGIHESNPHRLCGEIEGLIGSTEVTPAEIAEELMKSDDVDVALEGLVNFLKRKKSESSKINNEGESGD
ncbi:hypothetical protein ACLB2K_001068 [Fragaria x ananassa]